MKLFLRLLLCLLIGETAANATDVLFRLSDFASNPATNRTVWVQGMSMPTATTASVVVGQRLIRITDTNGEFTISNVAPMLYQCSVQAPPQQTVFKILVTATNLGTVNAHDILAADSTATFPAGSVAWAAATSDNRYARSTNSTASLTSATTGLSVSGGSGAVLGSGTTLTITNLPQSQILNLVADLGLKLPSDSTNQLVSTNVFILFTNAIYQFALTNGGSGGVSVAAGSLVTVSTNGTLATVAAVQQTNGLSLSAFLSPASLTNGFTDRSTVTNIARSITNGLATVTYVQAATNGYTSITTSNANAFARTNDDRLVYFGNTSSVFAGVTTNGVNVGSAFSSPGSGSPSEQFGSQAIASGISSTAIGYQAMATGNIGASAFGDSSEASAGNTTAVGESAIASEIGATAIGRAAIASGLASMAIGNAALATNASSFAVGRGANAAGSGAFAFGHNANAAFDNSMVFGNSVTATADNQIVFGDSSQYVLFPGNGTVAGTWTNGQVVLTNLIGDRNPIIIGTTNVIWMEDIGLSYFTNGAPYVWNGNNWSNQYNAAAIIFQNPTYFLRHGGTNFYSSSTPAGSSWSLVNGIAPAPTTGYGSYVRMNGLVFIGRHSDTNLEALIRAATNGLQLTAFLTPPQLTNGFVTSGITNGLATTNYVTSQGYVTATVTNGLATITYASNLVLVTSNGISARITGFNTNDYRPGSGITFSTNTPGIIQVNNALAISGSGIITNGGSGTNNYLKTPYIDTPLIVAPNNQNLYEIFYNRIAGTNNFINGAGTASFNVIAGGATNTTGFDQYGNVISGGVKNSFGNQVSWSTIGGGAWNQVASQINGVTIAGGESNLVATSDSSYATIPGGWGNRAARFSFAAGNQAWATNAGSWVWSDPQNLPPFGSTRTNQFLIRASGGVGINTNNPGTNALRVLGNVDADGFSQHGTPISNLYVASTNGNAWGTNTLFGAQSNALFSVGTFSTISNTPNTNFIFVTGAGSSSANGTYLPRGSGGGVVDYTNSSAIHLTFSGTGEDGIISNNAGTILYGVTSGDIASGTSSWLEDTGTPPPPDFVLYATNFVTNTASRLNITGTFPPNWLPSTNWYVAPWGNDTFAQRGQFYPFRTIAAAMRTATNVGEVVYVAAGTYDEVWNIPAGVSVIGAGSLVCSNVNVLTTGADRQYQMGQGSSLQGMTVGQLLLTTHNTLKDVITIASQDGVIWQSGGGGPFVAINCLFRARFDAVNNVQPWSGVPALFNNCIFETDAGGNGSLARGVHINDGYVILNGGSIVSSNGNSSTACAAVGNTAGTIELNGVHLQYGSTNAFPVYALNFESAGTIKVSPGMVRYADVNGSGTLLTFGDYFPTNGAPYSVTLNPITINARYTNSPARRILTLNHVLTNSSGALASLLVTNLITGENWFIRSDYQITGTNFGTSTFALGPGDIIIATNIANAAVLSSSIK